QDFPDGFVAVVKADGSALDQCGYLGGEGNDAPLGVAADRAGNAFVAGVTTSASLPAAGGIGAANHGSADAFVAKITLVAGGPPGPTIATVAKQGKKLVVTGDHFSAGAKILVNGTAYKTKADPGRPSEILKSG